MKVTRNKGNYKEKKVVKERRTAAPHQKMRPEGEVSAVTNDE